MARAAIPAFGAEAIRILGSESAVVVAFMVDVVVAGVIAELSHCTAQLKKEQRTLALAFHHPPLHRRTKKVSLPFQRKRSGKSEGKPPTVFRVTFVSRISIFLLACLLTKAHERARGAKEGCCLCSDLTT